MTVMPLPQTHEQDLRVERIGSRRYVGTSARGARVDIGSSDVEGVFTPGELLKIALGACSAMASDRPLARRLGEGYRAVVCVTGEADREKEVYPLFTERLELDLTEFDCREVQRIIELVHRSIESACTVGRTVQQGADVRLEVLGGDASALDGAPPRSS